MAKNIVKNYCNDCEKSTSHDILAQDIETSQEEYHCAVIFQIVRCRGCETRSFRHVFVDYEAAYPTHNDQWEVPETVNIYPKTLKNHREMDGQENLPRIVSDIYSEVLLALKEGADILAGLGLRASVEAVCNNLKTNENNLIDNIDKLARDGYITKKEAKHLHGIRFMGNDAAHDIKKPKREPLMAALKIFEHLVTSVYTFDKKVAEKLDIPISNYDEFEKLLEEKLIKFKNEDELSIKDILGEDYRRISKDYSKLEERLKNKINNGSFEKLSIGKLSKTQCSKKQLQHFIIK